MPRKRSPSSVLASKAWRPAAIRNTALLLVSAPQSVRLPPAVFQPVSSMLTTERRFELLLEPRVGRSECLPGPLDDRVDRAGRELDPEQLAGELGRVAARDPVADSERHDRGLQSRPERRPRHLAGKLGAGRAGACGAAHRPGAAAAPRRRPAPARRTHARTCGTAAANARRPRPPARAEAGVGASLRDRAGRRASGRIPAGAVAAAPTAGPATAAATSSASSASAAARALPPEPRAARSPRSTRRP